VVLTGPDRGQELRLDRSVLTVGRDPSCDLVLTDRRVSARHARLEVGATGLVVVDRDSTNGTWRAGQRVAASVELDPGEVITFGEVDVRYEVDDPGPAALPSAAAEPTPLEVVPAARPRTVLVSYDPVDLPVATRLVEVLQRAGHLVWIDRSTSGDGWGGRLLDTMWSCDAVVFVVSPAAADSERVRREVHLAGAEHTPVVPVVASPVDLPADLAFYLTRRRPIELWADTSEGLRQLVDEVGALQRKRVARPRRLFAILLVVIVTVALIVAGVRFALG
jgi:hypothetical protein